MDHAQALADALVAQRNSAMNDLAMRAADLAVANARVSEQDAEIATLKARVAELEAPLPATE